MKDSGLLKETGIFNSILHHHSKSQGIIRFFSPPRLCLTCPRILTDYRDRKNATADLCCRCLRKLSSLRSNAMFHLFYDDDVDDADHSHNETDVEVYAPYTYGPLIRKLVLDAKVGRKLSALDFCLKSFEAAAFWPGLLHRFQLRPLALVSAPASLPSRWRGRCDVAYMLAQHLSDKWGIHHHRLPWHAYLRPQKQATISSKERREHCQDPHKPSRWIVQPLDHVHEDEGISYVAGTQNPQSLKEPVYLIVDDVLTSGATLGRVIAQLPKAACFIAVVFAQAFTSKR